jgi:hypothetical protein
MVVELVKADNSMGVIYDSIVRDVKSSAGKEIV